MKQKEILVDENSINTLVSLLNEYRDYCSSKENAWKKFTYEKPQDDDTVLVSYINCEGEYSSPHRAYYDLADGKFFSLENNNSHPIVVDIWIKVPQVDVDK